MQFHLLQVCRCASLLRRGYVLCLCLSAWHGRVGKIHKVLLGRLWRRWWAFENTNPPGGRVKGAVVVVKRRVDIVKEIPD
jgi:hypothetical protein